MFAQPFVDAQIKENIRATGLCERNPPVTRGSPSQRASTAKNVSIWWRHHEMKLNLVVTLQEADINGHENLECWLKN